MVFMLARPLRCKRNVKVIQIPVERAVSVLVQLRAWCAFKVQCGSLQRLQVHGPESAPMGLLYQEAGHIDIWLDAQFKTTCCGKHQ